MQRDLWKTNLGLSEALSIRQLRKSYAKKRVEAAEGLDHVIPAVSLNTMAERLHWYVFHHLGENEFACIHDLPRKYWEIP